MGVEAMREEKNMLHGGDPSVAVVVGCRDTGAYLQRKAINLSVWGEVHAT